MCILYLHVSFEGGGGCRQHPAPAAGGGTSIFQLGYCACPSTGLLLHPHVAGGRPRLNFSLCVQFPKVQLYMFYAHNYNTHHQRCIWYSKLQ